MKRERLFWFIAVAFLAVDLGLKYWVRSNFIEHQSMVLIPRILDITLTYNKGIAFGMFQGFGVLLAPIAVAIAVAAMLYVRRHPNDSPSMHIAMGLLVAGALGNLYDRMFHAKVTDMFATRFMQFPVFNVADVCITVAGAILVLRWAGESLQGGSGDLSVSGTNPAPTDCPQTGPNVEPPQP